MELNIIKDFKTKTTEKIGQECFDIALANNFIDEFDAFFEHIFGNPEFRRFFLTDSAEQIKGFTVIEFQKIKELILCYIGIVFLHPSVQGYGYSKKLMIHALKESGINPDIVALRTHNPRMLGSFISTFDNGLCFPNPEKETPIEIIEIINSLPCSKNLDENLTARDVYDNEFVQQPSRNEFANQVFQDLGPTDAKLPTAVLNPNKVFQKTLGW